MQFSPRGLLCSAAPTIGSHLSWGFCGSRGVFLEDLFRLPSTIGSLLSPATGGLVVQSLLGSVVPQASAFGSSVATSKQMGFSGILKLLLALCVHVCDYPLRLDVTTTPLFSLPPSFICTLHSSHSLSTPPCYTPDLLTRLAWW